MRAHSIFKEETKAQYQEGKLFVAVICVFVGISCLGCTRGDKEVSEPAPSSPATAHPQPSPAVPQTTPKASQETSVSPEEKTPTEITKYPAETSTAAEQRATKSGESLGEQKVAPKESPLPSETSVVAEQGAVGSGEKGEEQKTLSPSVSKNATPTDKAAVQHAKEATSSAVPPSPRTGTVEATRLNVRQHPDLTATKLATIPRGTEVKITAEKDEWYHITVNNESLKGWVAKRYIRMMPTGKSSSNASAEM